MIKRVAVAIALVLSIDTAVVAAEAETMHYSISYEEADETRLDEDEPDQDDTWVSEDSDDFEVDEEYSDCDQAYCEEGSGCDC